ncbi:ArsA-related P-loop ATPase [Bdellovibrio svalbardensis]|uniref:arsenite-transporting ATPase n=1 Tax=Bdellovibrio svalbardensis TaxID=2972972 RepID=A0ABT6DE28_9BACT|nr:ArsA-related P-loop ATPase [Bdellovibrio svalbardensis]MDG0815084.1 arsenical pump-driving ATPase GET3 [Bdellovibrio svalbardensis]
MKQQIHFVTGKGGVGKSVLAAALALKLSQSGNRVLLVELGDQSFYRDFFDLPQVEFHPTQVKQNLSVALWSGDTCLREYAQYLIKVESLAKLFFDNAVMRAFINVAPALPELAILGKITSGPRKHGPALPFDCIVVDAFATGHFKALLEAPKGMAQAVQFGPMGEQSRNIDKVIRDKEICHYHIVTLPEELPLKEATELSQDLKSEFDIEAEIILNKMLAVPVSVSAIDEAAKEPEEGLRDFALYLQQHLHRQSEMVKNAQGLTKDLKSVPLFFETQPWKLVELIGEKL